MTPKQMVKMLDAQLMDALAENEDLKRELDRRRDGIATICRLLEDQKPNTAYEHAAYMLATMDKNEA